MNVEIGTKAAQFPEKEYIIGIFFAVWFKDIDQTKEVMNEHGGVGPGFPRHIYSILKSIPTAKVVYGWLYLGWFFPRAVVKPAGMGVVLNRLGRRPRTSSSCKK